MAMPTIDPRKQAEQEAKLVEKLVKKVRGVLGEYPNSIGMPVLAHTLARAAVLCEMSKSELQRIIGQAYIHVKQERRREIDATAAILRGDN